MAHVFTIDEKLRGIRKGIRTLKKKRTGPTWLIPSMEKYVRKLKQKQQATRGNTRPAA